MCFFQGGFKAIIWADAVQAVVLFSVLLLTIIIGTRDVGGFSEVWKRNEIGKRTDFFM